MGHEQMKIAFWGTSEFGGSVKNARFLRRLIASGVRPAVVVTASDSPRERGQAFGPLAVKSAALESGIPVLQPVSLKGFSEELAKREIDLSLVAAYGKILPAEVLAVPRSGSLNVHPSLLPRWRGPTPIQAALLAGDPVTGVTVIQMDAKMDHGPIIAQREFPLGDRAWTAPELSDALTDLGVVLLLEILEPWVLGKIVPQPQDHEAATYSRILKREDGHIDWVKPAAEIERMVRAFQPWPGAYTFWQRNGNAVRLAIERAGVENLESGIQNLESGTAFERNGGLGIRCGEGALAVERLKPEGGKSMSGEDFLRGHPGIVGAILK